MMHRVAAIDCGTNSVRLLIADGEPGVALRDVDRRLHLTRLGQGVDATGEFHPDALARTLDAVADFGDEIRRLGVEHIRFVATSAARDARNRRDFFDGVRQRVGVEAEIISGDEEAWLSYRGALAGLPGLATPVLVIDIGGGSTELVLGSRPDAVDRGVSLDMGSVRLRERFLHDDPPTAQQIGAATAYIDGLLDGAGIDFGTVRSWVGVGGTVTSLSALHQKLPAYDRARVNGSLLQQADVHTLAQRLLTMPVAHVRALPTMHPKRADVICAGALIASRIGARLSAPLLVSESDILDGIALGLLDRDTP